MGASDVGGYAKDTTCKYPVRVTGPYSKLSIEMPNVLLVGFKADVLYLAVGNT